MPRLGTVLACLWAVLGGLLGVAHAQDAPEALPQGILAAHAGLRVNQVSLEAPAGGLPRENLEPLLRSRQGERLDLGQVRLDVALLYRAGDFASVEAIAEPWLTVAEDGSVVDAVNLTYRVLPPPRLAEVEVVGASRTPRQIVLRALGVQPGDAFYDDTDVRLLEGRARAALGERGWPDAQVSAQVERTGRDAFVLRVDVRPGAPQLWGRIELVGDNVLRDGAARRCRIDRADCKVTRARIRRLLRRRGVVPGRRVVRAELDRALADVREELVRSGWLNARVSNQFLTGRGEASDLLLHLEGQGRVSVQVQRRRGRGRLPRSAELQQVLGLYEGTRPTDEAAREARRRLRQWFDERGYGEARARTSIQARGEEHRLLLDVQTGPRLRLRRIDIQGGGTFNPRYLAAAMREADPDGLEDGIISDAGLARGRAGLEEYYRGQGFLSADIVLRGTEDRTRWLGRVLRRQKRLDVSVAVAEGPRTRLVALEVVGVEDGEPGAVAVEQARDTLVGGPYRPARLEALSRTVSDAWRGQGHLGADVRVEAEVSEDGEEAHAVVVVEPGPQVRLRSVVIRGNRRTRRRVIERELALKVGAPVTPDGIRETRSNLYALDLFRVVSPELVGDDDRFRDLLVVLEEKPNLLFETGGGLSTDQGIRVRARASHRNLSGLGHKVTLLGQVGYGWFGDEWRLDLDEPVWQTALRYTAPHLPAASQQLVVEAVIGETVQEPVFRLRRSGGSVGLRSQLGRWEGFLAYRAQRRRLEDVETGALVVGDPWLDALGLEADGSGRPRLPSAGRVVTGPSLLLFRDGRDDRFNPTQGSFLSSLFEVSDGAARQVVTARGLLRMEQLFRLGPLVVNVGGRVGAGWTQGDGATLPLEERFYLGGSGSLRGFQLNTVGPANFAGRNDVPFPDEIEDVVEGAGLRSNSARWVPTGGDALAAGTLEFRIPFTTLGFSDFDSTQWVLFTDVGQVGFLDPALQPTSARRDRDQPFRTGLGTGVRISTPVGPAAVDLGFNPWPQIERDERRVVAHLSLGEL